MGLRLYYPPELLDPPAANGVDARMGIDDSLEGDQDLRDRSTVEYLLKTARGAATNILASDARGRPSEFAEGYAGLR